jgi:galactokinase/mevalonate kinase-like predicted kinase
LTDRGYKRAMTCVRELLESDTVEASAPCRIDAGGTWDIKAMALPLEPIDPATLNMALNLRTVVRLGPFDEGWVRISSDGFPRGRAFPRQGLSFRPPFGIFFAAVSHFQYHGLHVNIRSGSPVKSALGGSSTALVALLKALSKLRAMLGARGLDSREILHLGYHLEDAVAGGNCGLQDQAAAVYGGVNLWRWRYGRRNAPFERTPLLGRDGLEEISQRLLVAYSGESHVSLRTNRSWIRDFLSGRTRQGWIEANSITHALARAIGAMDWHKAAGLLREEMAIRRELTPEALIPLTGKLVQQAERAGCGARFAGAGAGGSLWALGETENMEGLKEVWNKTLSSAEGGRVLACRVDPSGVR